MVIKELSASAASHAITALAIRLARREVAPDATAQLVLCYLLPDEEGVSAFDGMRLASYEPSARVLTVEACIPKSIVNDQARAGRYVLAVAADAIDAAREFFQERHVDAFPGHELASWVASVSPKELAPPTFQQVRNTDFEWS